MHCASLHGDPKQRELGREQNLQKVCFFDASNPQRVMELLIYASRFGFLGQDPYDMHSAASALEKLSRGCHEDPLVDVSWSGSYFLVEACT